MAKTISVAQLGHGAASRAIREAEQEPVLVSRENRPAAWIIGAEQLARVAAARGVEPEVYQHALDVLAVQLYRDETLTIGQAAKLAGLNLGDFIDVCARLQVPILWEPRRGAEQIEAEADALEAALKSTGSA
jgi:hypothetical protein